MKEGLLGGKLRLSSRTSQRRPSRERNVDLHRQLYAAFNTRGIDGFIALCHPQIEFYSAFVAVGGVTVYRGHDGLREWGSGYEEVWGEEIRVEVEAYFDPGEQSLAFLTLRGRGRQSGLETAMQLAQVARWRDALCVYLKSYADRKEALAELGVSSEK
jgi:ketosteroid isomerase-like protein